MLKQSQNDNNTIHYDPGSEQNPSNSLEWISDQEVSTRHLTAQITDPKICGAILFSQGKQPLSYAGDIIESTAQQIADTISQYWDTEHRSEIARFITLQSSQVDYLLFALPFIQDIVLVVLFEPSYPLSKVRSQSKKLLRDLITTTPETLPTPEAVHVPSPDEDFLDDDFDEEYEGENDEFPDIDITNLLSHMPPPDPEIEAPATPEIEEAVGLPTDEAVLNDPSTIPAFLIPPSSESKLIEPFLENEPEPFAIDSGIKEKEQTMPQDVDLIPDSIKQAFISEKLSTSDQPDTELTPFIEQLVEESPAEEVENSSEASIDFAQGTNPELVEETTLIGANEDMESISSKFSLETDLLLPWEMEEVESSSQNDHKEIPPELNDPLIPQTDFKPFSQEKEAFSSSAQEDHSIDFLDNDFEGIPLPEDGTGWLAPFSQRDQNSNDDSNKPSSPIFSFEEKIADPTESLNSEVFTVKDNTLDIPTDESIEKELFSFLDSEIPAAVETETADSLPQEEPEAVFPLDEMEEIEPTDEIFPQEETGEPVDLQISEEKSDQADSSSAPAAPVGFPYELPDQIISDTRPNRIEPVSTSEPDEIENERMKSAYTCVLVPNLPENILTGALAKKLGEWLPQLSESFGWYLDKITIRPSHLQWTVEVPQTVSTGRLVHSIRIHTSQRIYDHFPELKRRSPEDFWSPSQLIISGEQSPTSEMLEGFIQKSRQQD